jgi:hypothetical protein
MSLQDNIGKLLNRLSVKINLPGFENLNNVYNGLAGEFARIIENKNVILSATVPNKNMTPDSIEDYNIKYGIPNNIGDTDEEQINRIMARSIFKGNGGKDFFEEQIQAAGFPLYVIENFPSEGTEPQLGDLQLGDFQLGFTGAFINPNTVIGEWIIGSSPGGRGKKGLSVLGDFQLGDFQLGTPDPEFTYPRPIEFNLTNEEKYYGYVFFLSPFPDRLATLESELLELDYRQWAFFEQTVIELKLMRNWCLAQVKRI